ncbi:MAG TPA: hypothetical protein VGM90_03230 [Kofleriaceae bacterium]|jgi:hypothetical protein
MTVDPSLLSPEPDRMGIGLLERNRTLLARATRVLRAAANFEWVAAADDPQRLRAALAEDTRLVACEGGDLDLLLGWTELSRARFAAWSHDAGRLVAAAAKDDRVVSLIGWPSYQSMPRPWEMALATKTILWAQPEPVSIKDILTGAPVVADFLPQRDSDRASVIASIAALSERAGAAERISARIGEVAHELVVNASYDAPVDKAGEQRYAHDRKKPITLAPNEVPHVQFATDGMYVIVQVSDRFGRLTREHVLASIQRGMAASSAAANDVVDSSNGGAGLGLWRVYTSSAVTIVDVLPGHSSTVTAVFDLDIGARDARALPPSLHLFDRSRLG